MSSATESSYDTLAPTYAAHIYGELAHKPFDRVMLDWLIQRVGSSLICDLGCGPGQVARYLADHGGITCGIDLSAGMIAEARRLNPDIDFQTGDMRDLAGVPDGAYGGIAAFYAIVNLTADDLPAAFAAMRRVLRPNGWLLLSYHVGAEVRHIEDLWGTPVNLDFIFYETDAIKSMLETAGFTVMECIERNPYPPEVEAQTRRAYVWAQRV